ncbi:MAG: CBS domain-containing protein [Actinomycetota bacterium]
MTAPVVTTDPEATLAESARLMHEHGVKRLPVIDGDGKLVGIVSRKDLLKIFLRADRDILRDVVHDVVDRTLWMGPEEAGLRVDVTQGIVRFEGKVDRRRAIRILVGLAWGIDGVVGVDNALSYRIDDEMIPTGYVSPSEVKRSS